MIVAALLLAAALETPSLADVPAEVRPFVERGMGVAAIERGDLNADGRADVLLVLEPSDPEQPRPLLLLVRDATGKLSLAKRSAKTVLCRNCGGVWGDPLDGIFVHKGRFTVAHYAGSNWRWSAKFTFGWSRRDQSWQLVRIEHQSYHTSDADKVETKVHVPPKHYGLIDVTEFDPEHYLGAGKK